MDDIQADDKDGIPGLDDSEANNQNGVPWLGDGQVDNQDSIPWLDDGQEDWVTHKNQANCLADTGLDRHEGGVQNWSRTGRDRLPSEAD